MGKSAGLRDSHSLGAHGYAIHLYHINESCNPNSLDILPLEIICAFYCMYSIQGDSQVRCLEVGMATKINMGPEILSFFS